MATAVEQMVANSVVGTMPAGSLEPAAARSAMTPVGSSVTLEVLIARNSAMALVAVPLCGLSVSSSCMARMPNGVAALPRPSTLAEMLRIIAPMAGCSAGTSGNRRTMSGRTARAMMSSSPPASATFIRPRNRAITPTRPMARVTASPAAFTMACDRTSMGDVSSGPPGVQVTSRTPAVAKATTTRAKKIAFKGQVRGQRREPWPCSDTAPSRGKRFRGARGRAGPLFAPQAQQVGVGFEGQIRLLIVRA